MININKQKITIEVENLKTFIDGLNNAIIAYNNIVSAIDLCCEIPSNTLPLKDLPIEELIKRQKVLINVYEQLIEIEKNQ